MKTLICLVTLMFSLNAFATCPSDKGLKSAGFTVYSQDFTKHLKDAENFFQSGREFIPDLDGTIFSSVADAMVTVKGHDSLSTSQDTMYGDIVFITSFETGEVIEVRWYENGEKRVAYDSSFQPCATNVVPMAVNALF